MADSLFNNNGKPPQQSKNAPLALRMRPVSLEEFAGQEHLLGKGKLLRRAIEADKIISLILFGPPGTGKTALAHVIANKTQSHFVKTNATTAGVEELRKFIDEAKQRYALNNKHTILFIDEVHRFNKLQQDALLPSVEDNVITLIGATTHNPYFFINAPLVSRSTVAEFYPLNDNDLKKILKRALEDKEKGLGEYNIKIEEKAINHLIKISDGDARKLLNALEIGVLTTPKNEDGAIDFTLAVAEQSIQKKAIVYDKDETQHYDTISAFIKSMRGSDPDAALYWLAKMLEAGEDPRFIARRIIICAAEDVGNADPQALVIANACFQACELIGMPEGRIPLAQATIYVSCAPKSNASYEAIEKASKDIKEQRTRRVPSHLQVGSYKGAEKLGRGVGYKYAHSFPGHFVQQDYGAGGKQYYIPSLQGYEKIIKQRLDELRKRKQNKVTEQDKKTS
ncbi:MAG: replication-associated recombination protein A [Candidatus Ratteibacteria bacterium]|nr:replication-associated recombination protein A [Candidatus Ratteibacteria bacterium]